MKYAVAAVLAAAAGASAHYGGNATVVTEVVDVYTTYCPGPTQITHGSKTYTVTEATTLTITDCPCTITKPILTTSAVVCHTCTNAVPTSAPYNVPSSSNNAGYSSVGYNNGTIPTGAPTAPGNSPTMAPPAGSSPGYSNAPSPVPTAGAGKAVALSGVGLAGVVGVAAFLL